MVFVRSKNYVMADWAKARHDTPAHFSSASPAGIMSMPISPALTQPSTALIGSHRSLSPRMPSPHAQSLPSSPRRPRVALTSPPSSPLYPQSPSGWATKRVPRPPSALIPPSATSLAQARRTADALVSAHPPKSVTAILREAPPPAEEVRIEQQHSSSFVPVPPSPRPATHRVAGAREMPANTLEQLKNYQVQLHEFQRQEQRAASRPISARPQSPLHLIQNRLIVASNPPNPLGGHIDDPPPLPPHVTDSHEEVWGKFQMHVYRKLAGPGDAPPPDEPVRRKLPRKRKPRKKPSEGDAADAEERAPEDESWSYRITHTLQQMAQKNHLKLMDVFKKYDSDGSGEIDQFEFEAALLELGLTDVPPYEARKVFELYDADSSGSLDFDELAKMIRAGRGPSTLDPRLQAGAVTGYLPGDHKPRFSMKDTMKMDACLERLRAIDTDGDGTADLKEIMAFLLAEGYDASAAEELMSTLDADGDGELSEEEWKAGVTRLSEQLEGAAGASALLALTEPVEPPPGDVFSDVLVPTLVAPDGKVPPPSSRGAARVATEPPKGCAIGDQVLRGIQLQQLRSFVGHVKRRCVRERWVTIDEEFNAELDMAPGSSSPLEWDKVNMYDLLAYVIKPVTRARRCSFVELVAAGPQPPAWYCAHRWGEPLVDTLACLERHAMDRGLDLNTTTYWICACAISPWDLDEHLTSDPFASPFYRALESTAGIVVVVDRDRSKPGQTPQPGAPPKCALLFARLWVCFEIAVALQMSTERGYLFDMYTAARHHLEGDLVHPPLGLDEPPLFIVRKGGESGERRFAVGLVDPTLPLEIGARSSGARASGEGVAKTYEAVESTAYRQSFFPSALLVQALTSKLQRASATVASDRQRILNALVTLYTQSQAKVAGAVQGGAWHLQKSASLVDVHRLGLQKATLEQEPPAEHEAYDVYNGLLQARLAPAALQRALKEGQATLDRVIKEVATAPLTVLRVSLRDAKDTAQFEDALRCLPESLRILELELPDVLYKVKPKVRDDADASTWNNVKVFPDLTKLALRQRPLAESEREKLQKMTRLIQPPEMVIGRLVGYAHDAALFRAEQLEHVDLSGWPDLETVPWNLFEMQSLRILNVSNCQRLTRIGVQFPLIPSQLESLIMDGCTAITELEEGIGMKLSNLTELGLANCTGLGKLPLWVNDLERKGTGVIRPAHLA